MSATYKRSFRMYSAWNYMQEVEDLNKMSDEGWQLVRGGCFHSIFVKNPDIRYRYQLDYQKIDDMARYIEIFREQGWEYVNSTFNGWHYLKKLYDPALPDEAYEIFTDRESLKEMTGRWTRFATILGVLFGIMAIIEAFRVITAPNLPRLMQLFTLIIESGLLLRGAFIMRRTEPGQKLRHDSLILGIFFACIFIGAASNIILDDMRPNFYTQQQADEVFEPIVENRWVDFDVKYPDNYYLDLMIKADEPLTFEIVNEADEVVYTETGTDVDKKDIKIKLPKGTYGFRMSVNSGFELACSID